MSGIIRSPLIVPVNSLTLSKLEQVAAARVLGSVAGGDVSELTMAQLRTLIDVFGSAVNGLVPASGGGDESYLCSDGTWDTVGGSAMFGDANDGNVTYDGAATVLGVAPVFVAGVGNVYPITRSVY